MIVLLRGKAALWNSEAREACRRKDIPVVRPVKQLWVFLLQS